MEVYFKTIHEYLCSEFSDVQLVHCSGTRYNASICSDPSQAESGKLLILSASELSGKIPTDSGVVFIGTAEDSLPECLDLIVIDASVNSAVIHAAVLSLFNKLLNWRENIYSTFYTGGGIQAILEMALEITDNPIYAHDHNYRMFSYAEKRSDNEEWNYDFYSRGRLSPETIRKLTNSPGFAETFTTTEPTYFIRIPEVEEYNYLYINLRINNKYAGRLFIDEKVRPITSMDYEIISVLADIIQISMSGVNTRLAEIPDRTRELLTSLAGGSPLSKNDLDYLQDVLAVTVDTGFSCVLIDCQQDDAFYNIKLSIGDIIESRVECCRSLIYEDYMIVVIFTDKESILQYAYNSISALVAEFRIKAGISQSRSDLDALYNLRIQAEIACRYAGEGETVHFYDCAFEYLLSRLTGELPAEYVSPEPLNMLREYDRSHGTEFIETLRIYLEENLSPSKSCERLFIHRSTFLYRLGRIKEIILDDLNNPDIRLRYMLALKLIN